MYVLTFTIHHAGIIVVSLITSKAKNKTANEKVGPKSTGLKGQNSELQAGETHLYKQMNWGDAS